MRIEISEFLSDRKRRGLSPRTVEWHRQVLTWFMEWAYAHEIKTVEQVTRSAVRAYTDFLLTKRAYVAENGEETTGLLRNERVGKPLSGRTVNLRLQSLKTFLRWCAEEEYITKAPKVELIKYDEERKEPIPPEVLARMLEITRVSQAKGWRNKTFLYARNHAIILVLLDTGIRVGELASVTVDRVLWERGGLLVQGKKRKERYVPISHETRKALSRYVRERQKLIERKRGLVEVEEAVLFLSETGRAMAYHTVLSMLKDVAREAGYAGPMHPHLFRHTFATRWMESGGNPLVAQEILGHESMWLTKRYSHLSDQSLYEHHSEFSPVVLAKQGRFRPLRRGGK